MARRVLIFAVLFLCGHLGAASGGAAPVEHLYVVHKFGMWGHINGEDKIEFFTGWTNGFFWDRSAAEPFARCLETMTNSEQPIAMIDKYYKEHPELWSEFIDTAILQALTVKGSPCEGKMKM